MKPLRLVLIVVLIVAAFAAGWVSAKVGIGTTVPLSSLSERERRFTEQMKESALVGRFTVTGREDRAAVPDRYDIASVEKLSDGRWRFNARLRHSGIDVTLPITVPLEWVGDTPMIVMTDYSIPTLGAFTARVFFYDGRYAGTWQHGQQVGGQMFGVIEKAK